MTWRPVLNPPSTRTRTRPRRPLSTRARWVSARPSSQAMPACLMEESGLAPVPPLAPDTWMTSASALAQPAAMVPTPSSATSFTETCARVDLLEVVDELGQVLDGVDVVVGRRGDQADAGLGVAQAGDLLGDLVAGQLAALAGLGALGHLDLQLVGVDQVLGGDPEAAGGDLLDAGVLVVAALAPGVVAVRVLAALTAVGQATEQVHGLGQRLVGLLGQGAVGHGARSRSAGRCRRRARPRRGARGSAASTSSSRSWSSVGGRSSTSARKDSYRS